MAFAFVALFSKCVKMQRTLFDAGLKRTNTITVDNSPDSCPKRSCHLSESECNNIRGTSINTTEDNTVRSVQVEKCCHHEQ